MTGAKKGESKPSPERTAALAAMQALPAAEVRRPPSYPKEHATWLRTLLAPMANDQAELVDAPLDPPLTTAELEIFPKLAELVGETAAGKQAIVANGVLTADETAYLAGLRAEQGKLDRAFRVRLRGDRAGLRMLADIRRGEPGDPEDLLSDARRLVALADSSANQGWIARLKKGEPAAVDALRTAIPRLEALATRVAGANDARLGRDQLRRAWTLALRLADRIVTAGKYLTADAPGREKDYTRFRPPPARKPKPKKGAASPVVPA
jgi:hypothetical protein